MKRLSWQRIAKDNERRFAGFDERKRYAFALLQFYGTPYRWGDELPDGSDCSGSVCFALAAATGYACRMTADALYRKAFTVYGAGPSGIQAAFFVARMDMREGSAIVPAGMVTHVAGIVAEGIALNLTEPAGRLREVADLRRVYDGLGYDLVLRGLDRDAYADLAKPVGAATVIESPFCAYFEEAKQ
jgi:murein DD-endopeptidase